MVAHSESKLISLYNHLLSQAKNLLRGKVHPFTEHDIANEVFVLLKGHESAYEINKIIRKCYSSELRQKLNHFAFEDQDIVKRKWDEKEAICIMCKETYSLSNFRIHMYNDSGYFFRSCYCIPCQRQRSRDYVKNNKEKFKEICKRTKAKKPEKYRALKKESGRRVCENLTDGYIRSILRQKHGHAVIITDEMIIKKREQLIKFRDRNNNCPSIQILIDSLP